MAQTVGEVMTPDPVTLDTNASILAAAEVMRECDIGDILVCDDGRICGIVTDRDLVVRALADGHAPDQLTLRDVCSPELTMTLPDTEVDDAVRLMREKALRRLPVVEDGRPIGIVSLGDLAIVRDPMSALADISAAPPNT